MKEALPGLAVDADKFFPDFSAIVHDLAPKNRALLLKRDQLQAKIDHWYRQNDAPTDMDAYQSFRRAGDLTAAQGPLVCLVGFAGAGALDSRPDLVAMIRGLPGGGWDGDDGAP